MSAPRWTLSRNSVICRDESPLLVVMPWSFGMTVGERDEHTRRIVALLNATELTSDAVAVIQTACMHVAAVERMAIGAQFPEHQQRADALDKVVTTLNHAVRMYVELNEEASIALDEA